MYFSIETPDAALRAASALSFAGDAARQAIDAISLSFQVSPFSGHCELAEGPQKITLAAPILRPEDMAGARRPDLRAMRRILVFGGAVELGGADARTPSPSTIRVRTRSAEGVPIDQGSGAVLTAAIMPDYWPEPESGGRWPHALVIGLELTAAMFEDGRFRYPEFTLELENCLIVPGAGATPVDLFYETAGGERTHQVARMQKLAPASTIDALAIQDLPDPDGGAARKHVTFVYAPAPHRENEYALILGATGQATRIFDVSKAELERGAVPLDGKVIALADIDGCDPTQVEDAMIVDWANWDICAAIAPMDRDDRRARLYEYLRDGVNLCWRWAEAPGETMLLSASAFEYAEQEFGALRFSGAGRQGLAEDGDPGGNVVIERSDKVALKRPDTPVFGHRISRRIDLTSLNTPFPATRPGIFYVLTRDEGEVGARGGWISSFPDLYPTATGAPPPENDIAVEGPDVKNAAGWRIAQMLPVNPGFVIARVNKPWNEFRVFLIEFETTPLSPAERQE